MPAIALPNQARKLQASDRTPIFQGRLAVGAIAGHAWHQITTYPQRKQEHEGEVTNYPTKLKDYEIKKHQHEEEVKAARSPERVAEFRHKLLLQVLSQEQNIAL